MEDLNKLGTIIEEMIINGELDDMDMDDLNEVLRIVKPKSPKERAEEGITFIEAIDGNGREVCYLDGGRGIRLKISRLK